MPVTARALASSLFAFVAGVAACYSPDASDCARGTLACTCQPDGGCAAGLECEGTICVSPGELGSSSGDDVDTTDDPQTTTPSTSATTSIPPLCGDGACDPDEQCTTCPEDCGECPAVCGDGSCDADESCASCADDCGQCCGDGSCEPEHDESWAVCWSDCKDTAPMQSWSDVYVGCAGLGAFVDDDDEGDWLWVRSDTHALVYVDGDEVFEVADSVVEGDTITIGGETLGTLGCQQTGAGSCAPAIVAMTGSNCYGSSYGMVDVSRSGDQLMSEYVEYAPCSTECGDGTCDAHESWVPCSVHNGSLHYCASDCGEEGQPCEVPAC